MSKSSEELILFEERVPIYPRSVKGRYRNVKWAVLILAYGVYFVLPWIRWQRESSVHQAVMFDIHDRIFYLFGMIVNPQDIFWLAAILMIAAFLLFFVTGIAGRAFCGYFCFQTLWTDVYMFVERIVQGERPARIRLDKQPWTREKIIKKALTHFLWLVVSFVTGLTFTLYWGDAYVLMGQFFTGQAPFPAYATTLFLTVTTYVMAGLAREQVCTYMCPYARFQSIMFDTNTLIVAYDESRGEGSQGRAKLGKDLKTREERQIQGVGDCIDCGFCVQVCPTGIDIRNGLQMSCISCALCIDACDTIMDKLEWPRGLIRYASENEMEGRKTHFFTLKNIAYALVLLAAIGGLVWSVINQSQLSMSVTQVRNPLYVMLSDGRIQNSYDIKLNNKSEKTITLNLTIEGLPGATLDLGKIESLQLEPLSSINLYVRVKHDHDSLTYGQLPFHFVLQSKIDDEIIIEEKEALFTMKEDSGL
jgi:cytochrome c oxidase accessory protein FixG